MERKTERLKARWGSFRKLRGAPFRKLRIACREAESLYLKRSFIWCSSPKARLWKSLCRCGIYLKKYRLRNTPSSTRMKSTLIVLRREVFRLEGALIAIKV